MVGAVCVFVWCFEKIPKLATLVILKLSVVLHAAISSDVGGGNPSLSFTSRCDMPKDAQLLSSDCTTTNRLCKANSKVYRIRSVSLRLQMAASRGGGTMARAVWLR